MVSSWKTEVSRRLIPYWASGVVMVTSRDGGRVGGSAASTPEQEDPIRLITDSSPAYVQTAEAKLGWGGQEVVQGDLWGSRGVGAPV